MLKITLWIAFQGHYLYADDTNTTYKDKAMLRSPVFSMAARGCTFSFWYFVYGFDMGTIKVYQYTPSDRRDYNLMTAVDQTDDASTADRWNLYEVEVAACAQQFRVVFFSFWCLTFRTQTRTLNEQ